MRAPAGRAPAGRAAPADGRCAPWEAAGQLIARFHRAGLDHADLNAHNILFDGQGRGWFIDLDRRACAFPPPPGAKRNLARLHRSLRKLRGTRSVEDVDADFARLRAAYSVAWDRGY